MINGCQVLPYAAQGESLVPSFTRGIVSLCISVASVLPPLSTIMCVTLSLKFCFEFNLRPYTMVMGANIGTSVTNTIVAMGHFANQEDLRRGGVRLTLFATS